MGIPSYYKKLCDSVPGILTRDSVSNVESFWIDFNCLIYYCIRRPGTSLGEYTGEENRLIWEKQLIKEVCIYTKQIVAKVNPSKIVYIAIDGVVPMAKMRQQRLRRFKSIWVAKEEIRCGKPDVPRWDTNSITPGTVFMEMLSKELVKLCKTEEKRTGVQWMLSDEKQPGEGEQKIVSRLREMKHVLTPEFPIILYGLDADLIVLSLLLGTELKQNISLFREAIECGEIMRTDNVEEYKYLNISKLGDYISCRLGNSNSSGNSNGNGNTSRYIVNYCMAMSLLGNDFLPHSISFSLKQGGHDSLLELLQHLISGGFWLIDDNVSCWNVKALSEAFKWLALKEDGLVEDGIRGKFRTRFHTRGSTKKVEAWTAECETWNKLPVTWFVESALVESPITQDYKCPLKLKSNWRQVYNEQFIGVYTPEDIESICYTYCEGLQWILDYYMSRYVDPEWMFSWNVPPTWDSLVVHTNQLESLLKDGNNQGKSFLQPQEQLAIVLPLESYHLIRNSELRKIPKKIPQFWPSSFDVVSLGRKMMWECEAKIPLLTPARLRFLLKRD
jgi:5'-3' exonuclease